MARETCKTCNRNVVIEKIGGELFVTEPEIIDVIPLRRDPGRPNDDGVGRFRALSMTQARRLHAGLCPGYVEQNRKERIARELRAFEAKQRRAQNRNHGL